MFILALVVGFLTYDKYEEYNGHKVQYDAFLNKLVSASDDLAIDKEYQESVYTFLDKIKKDSDNRFVSDLHNIIKNIDYLNEQNQLLQLKPKLDNYSWQDNEKTKLSVKKELSFESLQEMSHFKDHLEKTTKDKKKSISMNCSYDFNDLYASCRFEIYGESL